MTRRRKIIQLAFSVISIVLLLIAQTSPAFADTYGYRVDLCCLVTSDRTAALAGVNTVDGTGVNLNAANMGVMGVAHGSSSSSTATYNIGVYGQARWAAQLSIGVQGVGTDTSGAPGGQRLNASTVGVYGRAATNGSGLELGGVFVSGPSDPTWTSAALLAESQDSTPAFVAHNGSTETFVIASGYLYLPTVPTTPVAPPPLRPGLAVAVIDASTGKLCTYVNSWICR